MFACHLYNRLKMYEKQLCSWKRVEYFGCWYLCIWIWKCPDGGSCKRKEGRKKRNVNGTWIYWEKKSTGSTFFVSVFFSMEHTPFSFCLICEYQKKSVKNAFTFIFLHFNRKHLKIKMRILDLRLADEKKKQPKFEQTNKQASEHGKEGKRHEI